MATTKKKTVVKKPTVVPSPLTGIADTLKADQAALAAMQTSLKGLASDQQGVIDLAKQGTTDIAAQTADRKAQIAGNAALAKQLGATIDPQTGIIAPPVGGYTTAGLTSALSAASSTLDESSKDAYSLMESQFSEWGIPEAATFFQDQMIANIGPNQALLNLRNQQFYKDRFAGNAARVTNGMNALKEADYVALENAYGDLFVQYGAQSLANKNTYAQLMGAGIAAPELNSRLDLSVNQIQQADPTVLATLKTFYPGITTGDIVAYFLSPEETLPMLQRKVQTADIGAAAIQAGLSTGLNANANTLGASALAAYGVGYKEAQIGYGKIAEVLPASEKLSAIYGAQTGINYNQITGEQQYLENSGAAVLEQQKLKDMETAQFSGRSGIVGANAQGGYSGSLGRSVQGVI